VGADRFKDASPVVFIVGNTNICDETAAISYCHQIKFPVKAGSIASKLLVFPAVVESAVKGSVQ
jgi:hypothetical protein